jgi:hypothetical protein
MIALFGLFLALFASLFKSKGRLEADGFAERLIGSIRRECVDHVVVLGEAHLRQILRKYSAYYNDLRTHRSLAGRSALKGEASNNSLTRFTSFFIPRR